MTLTTIHARISSRSGGVFREAAPRRPCGYSAARHAEAARRRLRARPPKRPGGLHAEYIFGTNRPLLCRAEGPDTPPRCGKPHRRSISLQAAESLMDESHELAGPAPCPSGIHGRNPPRRITSYARPLSRNAAGLASLPSPRPPSVASVPFVRLMTPPPCPVCQLP